MSKYEKEIDAMTFSFSRCHSFEGCKYEWYLNYILVDEHHRPLYESEQNFYAAFGKFCHELLEKIFKKEMTVEQAAQRYIDPVSYTHLIIALGIHFLGLIYQG